MREVAKGDEVVRARRRGAGAGTRAVDEDGTLRLRSTSQRRKAPPRKLERARLVVNVDGGARGNPGPAAIAAVVATPDGEILEERAETIGPATNNVAEYRALLLGIERARALGADEVELVGDSELIVRQVRGEYRVKDAGLRDAPRPGPRGARGLRALVDPPRAPRGERRAPTPRQRGARRAPPRRSVAGLRDRGYNRRLARL